jgi:hypothetical protein
MPKTIYTFKYEYLTLDEINNIPLNLNNDFLLIKRSDSFLYSLDLCFNYFDPGLDLKNLFLAIKSFSLENEIIVTKLLTSIINKYYQRIVTSSFQGAQLKVLELDDFRLWAINRVIEDWRYTYDEENYVISICLDKTSIVSRPSLLQN